LLGGLLDERVPRVFGRHPARR